MLRDHVNTRTYLSIKTDHGAASSINDAQWSMRNLDTYGSPSLYRKSNMFIDRDKAPKLLRLPHQLRK